MEGDRADTVHLKKIADEAGLEITYENGQRSLGPPKNWTGEAPPRGTEIHIGRIPRYITEEDLFSLFAKCGTIYTFRLMLSMAGGENRGYCFVKYATLEEANAAIKQMDGHEIDGKPLRVQRSVENQKLFVRPIPLGATATSIYEELSSKLAGIIRVTVHPNSKSLEEQYAFLEFGDHKAAALARKRILERKASYNGTTLYVDWALPAENKNLPRTLRIRNANPMTKEEDFRQLLNSMGNGGLLTLALKKKYVQAQFDTFDNAQAVINKMHGFVLDGNLLVVNWKRGYFQRMHHRPMYTKLGPDFFQFGQFNPKHHHVAMPVVPYQAPAAVYHEGGTTNSFEPDVPLVQFMPFATAMNMPFHHAPSVPAPPQPPQTSSIESSSTSSSGPQFRGTSSYQPHFGVLMQQPPVDQQQQQQQNQNVVYQTQQQQQQLPTYDQQILYAQLQQQQQQMSYDQLQSQGSAFEHVVYAQPAAATTHDQQQSSAPASSMFYAQSGPARLVYQNVPYVIDYNRLSMSQ